MDPVVWVVTHTDHGIAPAIRFLLCPRSCLKSAKNREWHFKATATEADSKLTTSFQWASSAQEAIQAASKKLFEENPQLAAKCYSYSANSQQALARDVAGLMPEWADVEASWGTIEWEEDEFRIDDPIFHNDGEVGLQW